MNKNVYKNGSIEQGTRAVQDEKVKQGRYTLNGTATTEDQGWKSLQGGDHTSG